MSESTTYKGMLDDLERIVRDVQTDGLDLDALVQQVERGYGLIKDLRARLDQTRDRLETLRASFEPS